MTVRKRSRAVDLDQVKSTNRDSKPLISDQVDLFKFPPNKPVQIRLLGSIYMYSGYWIKTTKKDGSPGKYYMPSPSFDPVAQTFDSTIFDPFYAYSRKEAQAKVDRQDRYIEIRTYGYVLAIIRGEQAKRPSKLPRITESERETGFKEKDSDSWTPIRVVRLSRSVLEQLAGIASDNIVNGKNGPKAFSLLHPRFGMDVKIRHNPKAAPAMQYQVLPGSKRTPLTEEELAYLRYNLDDLEVPETEDEVRQSFDRWVKAHRVLDPLTDAPEGGDDEDDEDDAGDQPKSRRSSKATAKSKPASKSKRREEPEDSDDDWEDDEEEEEDPSSRSKSKSKRREEPEEDDEDEDDWEDEEGEDEEEAPRRSSKSKPASKSKRREEPEDEEDDWEDEEEDDEDEPPRRSSKSSAKTSKSKRREEPEDEEDDDWEDEEDEEEDEPPRRSSKSKPAPKSKRREEPEEDDDDDDDDDWEDEDEDEDEEEDEPPRRSSKSKSSAATAKSKRREEPEEDDDWEDEEDDEDEPPRRSSKSKPAPKPKRREPSIDDDDIPF